jgi:hypothetical protein
MVWKLEKGELLGRVVEDRRAVQRARDRVFVGNDRIEVGFGFEPGFDHSNEAFEAAEAVEFVRVTKPCCIERGSEQVERFVIRLQRDRKWMTILAAVRK